MIYAEIIFSSNDIMDLDLVLPFPPRVGENIEFPSGAIKYKNGFDLEDRCFKIASIDWVLIESKMAHRYKFQKLSIFVERP